MSKLWIIVDDGVLFDGSLEQFKDNFFSNATRETIQDWADDNEYTVEFEER